MNGGSDALTTKDGIFRVQGLRLHSDEDILDLFIMA